MDEHASMEPVALRRQVRRRDPLRQRTHAGFKTVRLNAVGWGALLGAGGAAGAVLWYVTGLSLVITLPTGIGATWLILVALDHRRWRSMRTRIGYGGLTAEQADAVLARLRADGIEAVAVSGYDDSDDLTIECANPHASAVHHAIADVLGLKR